MKTCKGDKSWLRDVSVNLVGVLIAAIISITAAFLIYDFRNQNQCNSILKMILEENRLNEQASKIILDFLSPIVDSKSKDTLSIQGFHIRMFSKGSIIASESELLARYVPSDLRSHIVIYSENLQHFNDNLDSFNVYVRNHLGREKISFSLVKKWAFILIKQINKNIDDSKKVSGKISKYLNEN
jgi:hypothetical protein